MPEIRKARVEDLDRILELWKRFIKHQRDLGIESGEDLLPEMKEKVTGIVLDYFGRTIRSRNGFLIVMEDKGEIVGYLLARIEKDVPVFKNDRIGYISDIYLEERFRKKGLGLKMFGESLRWFKEKGIVNVTLKVLSYNSEACDAYRRWGFKDVYHDMNFRINEI
jgi:ribosomal protein S18 acetylase RimI-like enzyme